jgi:AraC family transcriptional regulator
MAFSPVTQELIAVWTREPLAACRESAYLCQKPLITGDAVAVPVWFKVREQLGHQPIVAGRIPGRAPLFAERYIYQDIEKTVRAVEHVTTLVVQFGGGRVLEGEPDRLRSRNLPTQSMLIPKATDTHWRYSGTVDFAVFYFLEPESRTMKRLALLAGSRGGPVPFSDPLVGASAQRLLGELQKGPGADAGFMEQLAAVMLEQAFRALVAPAHQGINPRHVHFSRIQAVLNHIHGNPAADLSARRLASRAGVSLAHFCRIFREAVGVAPHRYVLAARLDLARKLLTQSTMPICRIAQECGFSSQSHLTASFRAAHSTTPARFRAAVH